MTDYKSILVHLDAGHAAARRLEYAIDLARTCDAHVACLYALDPIPELPGAYEARHVVLEQQREARAAMRTRAAQGFEDIRRRSGYERLEWRATEAEPRSAVALHARYADLVVAGQHDPDSPGGVDRQFLRDLPLMTGRPVLVVPYTFEAKGAPRRALVAWNASREAARAVSDALPLLRRVEHVQVVSVNAAPSATGHGAEPGADVGLYLARHGLKVAVSRIDAPDVDTGNLLLSRAFDLQADLIVSGAWGHSRLRESVLGGVTRTFLESMTVPVLMSH